MKDSTSTKRNTKATVKLLREDCAVVRPSSLTVTYKSVTTNPAIIDKCVCVGGVCVCVCVSVINSDERAAGGLCLTGDLR